MAKKTFAAIALATLAVLAVPTAAVANGYGNGGSIIVNPNPAAPGSTVLVTFEEWFQPDEPVSLSVTGEDEFELSVFTAVVTDTIVNDADGDGTVELTVELPDDAVDSYLVTGTGLDSATVGQATIHITAEDEGEDDGLAATGVTANAPLLIGGALGLLLLGAAALVIVRRRAKA